MRVPCACAWWVLDCNLAQDSLERLMRLQHTLCDGCLVSLQTCVTAVSLQTRVTLCDGCLVSLQTRVTAVSLQTHVALCDGCLVSLQTRVTAVSLQARVLVQAPGAWRLCFSMRARSHCIEMRARSGRQGSLCVRTARCA